MRKKKPSFFLLKIIFQIISDYFCSLNVFTYLCKFKD